MSDRKEVRSDHSSIADTGWFHEECGQELGERLQFLPNKPQRIVDVGCRVGPLSRSLRSNFPDASVISGDALTRSGPETEQGKVADCCPDSLSELERMSLEDGSAGLIVSNLSASYCDPKAFFAECYRILRADGALLFSMFAAGSLEEFRLACRHSGIALIDGRFPEMRDIGDLLLAGGFANPVVDTDCRRVRYPDIQSLIQVLDQSGAFAAMVGDHRPLSKKSVQSELSEQFHDLDGNDNFMLTVDVIYGVAWKNESGGSTAHVHFHPVQA
ncbi:MAG: methyltransferase domain-containing protein [Acidiferrobacterales bacterium]|nr:methyltransferase domain-containing protein [Acidiferrobacterales bacterium]